MNRPVLIAAAVLLTACAGEPAIQSGPGAEQSFDGLFKIENSRFANAWADPDVDFASYDRILIGNAEFEFRAVKERARTSTIDRSKQREFWISDEDKHKLVDTVTAIFLEARDSLSGETIYRAIDRSSIEPTGGGVNNPGRSNSATTWAEARRWAIRLVDGLDSIHE